MPAEQTRADACLAELSRIYGAPGSRDALTRRQASWLNNADQTVLLFLLLAEIRALRAELRPKNPGDRL